MQHCNFRIPCLPPPIDIRHPLLTLWVLALRRAATFAIVARMNLQSVRAFFANHAPDIEVIVTEDSSATVTLAAAAHNVAPDQIAKTICVRAGDLIALIVMAGTMRLDNRKFKDRFSAKPRMLSGDDVMALTSHPVGGVCPFGLSTAIPVYCDQSLRKFAEVVPAAGATNAAVRISPDRMAELTGATWVDVTQAPTASA